MSLKAINPTVTDLNSIITPDRYWCRLTQDSNCLLGNRYISSTEVRLSPLSLVDDLFVTQLARPNQLFLFWQKRLYLPSSCPLTIINRAEGCRWGRAALYGDRSVGCTSGASLSWFEVWRKMLENNLSTSFKQKRLESLWIMSIMLIWAKNYMLIWPFVFFLFQRHCVATPALLRAAFVEIPIRELFNCEKYCGELIFSLWYQIARTHLTEE